MKEEKQYKRLFKAVDIENSINPSSVFSISHIYMPCKAMKQMGLSWGQAVKITNLSIVSEVQKQTQCFVFIKPSLANDQIILGEEVAKAISFKKTGADFIQISSKKKQNSRQRQEFSSDQAENEENAKNFKSSPTPPPFIYSKKQHYEAMCFTSDGKLKIQIKAFTRTNFNKIVRLLHSVNIEKVKLDQTKIIYCLNDNNLHNILPDMGIILLKPEGQGGQKYQIQLKQVPLAFSMDTQMTMAYLLSMKKQLSSRQSLEEPKTSFFKNDPSQQIIKTPNTFDTSAGKSTARASQFSGNYFYEAPILRRKKDASSDDLKVKNTEQVEVYGPQMKSLNTKLMKLEEQIRILKQSQEKLIKKTEKNSKRMEEISQEANQKLNCIVKEDEMAIQKFRDYINQIHEQYQEKSQSVAEILKKSYEDIDKKCKDFSKNCSKISANSYKPAKEQKSKENLEIVIPLSPSIDMTSPFISKFQIRQDHLQTVMKKGMDEWIQLVTRRKIEFAKKFSFSIKIVKTKFSFIMFGLIDRKMAFNKSSCHQEKCIAFLGWSGAIFVNGEDVKSVSEKFKQNSEIVMEVDLEQGLVHWRFNECVFTINCDTIKDQDVEWVPYIEMFSNGDIIQWL